MSTIVLGPTTPGPTTDNGNGGLLCATKVALAQQATLQALSFYVQAASGQLNLGVYADSNGAPGTLIAQTGPFAPGVGWNPVLIMPQPVLQPGSYWLAYLAQDNALAFRKTTPGGISRTHAVSFGALPAAFPAAPLGTSASIWSHNATLAAIVTPPPPPPPPATITVAVNVASPSAATVAVSGAPAKLIVTATAYDVLGNMLATQTAHSGTVTPPPPPPSTGGLPAGVTLQAIDGESAR